MPKVKQLRDEVIYEVVDRFFSEAEPGKKRKVKDIADEIGTAKGVPLTREDIYPILTEARERGFLKVCPPTEIALAQRITDYYRLPEPADDLGQMPVQVVDVRGPGAIRAVAIRTAEVAVGIVRELFKQRGKEEVHIGLASGFTALRIAQHLAELLRHEPELPKLFFHSLSGGYSATNPEKASVSFFSMFHSLPTEVEFVALFAPPFVPTADYQKLVERMPPVSDAFERRHEIDIVITALASRMDQHGELNQFFKAMPDKDPDTGMLLRPRDQIIADVEAMGWAGDVQYRPFSHSGPIDLGAAGVPWTLMTLFGLTELAELAAREDKAVILAGAPCVQCQRKRADAVDALLQNEKLRVSSHTVVDSVTAVKLVTGDLMDPMDEQYLEATGT